MCLQAHKDGLNRKGEAGIRWRFDGSGATLASWGGAVPPKALRFMESLPLYHESRDMIFVHGGVVPELPLEYSDADDLLWSRNEAPHCSGKTVVAGHTVQSEGVTFDAKANTLFIDTGAFFAVQGRPGRLSIVDLTNRMVYFIRTDTESGAQRLDVRWQRVLLRGIFRLKSIKIATLFFPLFAGTAPHRHFSAGVRS
jgi:hypothetical protein